MGISSLRRRFSLASQKELSFRVRHHLWRQGVTLTGTKQLRSYGPVTVHAHCTPGVKQVRGTGVGTGTGTGWEQGQRREREPKTGTGAAVGTVTGAAAETGKGT